MASGNSKQGGDFAFCLIFMHEEAVLGPGPVFPASLYARLWAWPLPPGLRVKWQALVRAVTFCLTSNSVQPPGRQQGWRFSNAHLTVSLSPKPSHASSKPTVKSALLSLTHLTTWSWRTAYATASSLISSPLTNSCSATRLQLLCLWLTSFTLLHWLAGSSTHCPWVFSPQFFYPELFNTFAELIAFGRASLFILPCL